MSDYNRDIMYIKGVGEKKAQLFKKRLGLSSLDDIISFYPRSYQDWTSPYKLSHAPINENVCVEAKIADEIVKKSSFKSKIETYNFTIYDRTGTVKVVIFNNKYLAKTLKTGEKYRFYGKIKWNGIIKEMDSPEIRDAEYNKIRPIYHSTEGITSRQIEKITENALQSVDNSETLPKWITEKYQLMSLHDALINIHYPKDLISLEKARTRLSFEEMFLLRLGMKSIKNRTRRNTAYNILPQSEQDYLSLYPFKLTDGQKSAVDDCINDMKLKTPMNRIIQGDVGCGKTAVAAILCYNTVKAGHSAIMLVPTEILARQHYISLSKVFEKKNISVNLLTGTMTAKKKRLVNEKLKSGKAEITISTHAVLSKDVELNNVGLIITDEQHRFGVEQRSVLSRKANYPHTLVMSATPIPRTLGLAIYGDLDISAIRQLPSGRKQVKCYGVTPELRDRALTYVRKHIDQGYQGYIVCPLVDENDSETTENLKSVKEYFKDLSEGPFLGYSLGLLHAKMKADDKKQIMRDFAEGKIKLLISTTVIEVGVDVPNAAIIIIENAERFGLSQLHQLRGRVGRSNIQSTCIFIYSGGETAKRRINIMCSTNDGFKIAEADLEMRGPGNFLGRNQHGLPDLKIGDIISDGNIIKNACDAADSLLEKDPLLMNNDNSVFKKSIDDMFNSQKAVDLI